MINQPENMGDRTFKRSVMLVAAFAAFLTPFLGSAVNLALPSIGKDLDASAIGLSWVISSFILSSAIFLLPFGRLADIIGRKKVFTAGIFLFTCFNFSDNFLPKHNFTYNSQDLPGHLKCNDLRNKSCNNNFCFPGR